MRNSLLFLLSICFLSACALKGRHAPSRAEGTSAKTPAPIPAPVNPKDVELLEQMNKAVEEYALKNKKQSFKKLCQDKRFDCFVNEKAFPKKKKKIDRSALPFASGSKVGRDGEENILVRYEFFP